MSSVFVCFVLVGGCLQYSLVLWEKPLITQMLANTPSPFAAALELPRNSSTSKSNAKAAATAGLSVSEDSDALREHQRASA